MLVDVIYDSELQLQKLDISENPQWGESCQCYQDSLFKLMNTLDCLKNINLSFNQKEADDFLPVL